ncbi:MAG TPA: hypothetical protein VGV90_15115 [Solirubrobacteraceae bacterium]|nr:hypothetical protein [Solirubrobacteraceae bacterium]
MLVLIALGMLAWILSCVVVVSICVMAARGDGRHLPRKAPAKAPGATRHFVIR